MARGTRGLMLLALWGAACSAAHPRADFDAGAGIDAASEHDAGTRDAGDATVFRDSRSDGPDTTVPPRDAGPAAGDLFLPFCRRYVEIFTEANLRCCTRTDSPVRHVMGEGDPAFCHTIADHAAMRDGTILWDAAGAEEYLRVVEVAAATCAPFERYEWGLRFRLFEGTLPLGADCTPETLDQFGPGNMRCLPSLMCRLEGTRESWTGTCVEPGGLDSFCDDAALDCEPGFFCDFRADFLEDRAPYGRCRPIVGIGERCVSDFGCTTGICPRTSVPFACEEKVPGDDWCGWII